MKMEGPLEKEMNKSVVIKRDMGKYDDIINLEHHVSKNHKPMSIYDRSAQFAPFAALVGYDESINEAGRVVDKKIELGADKIDEISQTLSLLMSRKDEINSISITYFQKDKTKNGGKYLSIVSQVKKIDTNSKIIVLENNTKISFCDIIDIALI